MHVGSISSLIYRKPWIVPHAIPYLESIIRPHHNVLEFGSGGSTLWFADHALAVESIEHSRVWRNRVAAAMTGDDDKKIELRLIPNYCKHDEIKLRRKYDVIFIDGIHRRQCFKASIDRLADGGILIVDNSNRDEIKPIRDSLRWPTTAFRDGGWSTTFWFKPRN